MATRRKGLAATPAARRPRKTTPEPERVRIDERPLDEQEPPPSLEALAEALRRLEMSPEAVLERAILGEVALRDLSTSEIERTTRLPAWRFLLDGTLRPLAPALPSHAEIIAAVKREPPAMHSPRVAEVVTLAAWRCYYASADSKVRRLPVDVQFLYRDLPSALTAVSAESEEWSAAIRLRPHLRLAWRVQAEAEGKAARSERFRKPDGKPSNAAITKARQEVAKEEKLSVAAMQLRISRASKAAPDAGWPEIMPRPPKKRRA